METPPLTPPKDEVPPPGSPQKDLLLETPPRTPPEDEVPPPGSPQNDLHLGTTPPPYSDHIIQVRTHFLALIIIIVQSPLLEGGARTSKDTPPLPPLLLMAQLSYTIASWS